MFYNVRIKVFPDGTKQMLWSEKARQREYEITEPEKEKKHDGESVERKEVDNMKRAVQVVYDLAKSNVWDWFITLTISPESCDRYDYEKCADEIKLFTDLIRHYGCRWLVVPEQHKDGAYHFHGLVQGDLPVVAAVNPKTGENLLDDSGNQVYNISCYQAGWATATRVQDSKRVASYISKYLAKDILVPKGKKRYWASRKLQKPELLYDTMSKQDFYMQMAQSRYWKEINGPYGQFYLCED